MTEEAEEVERTQIPADTHNKIFAYLTALRGKFNGEFTHFVVDFYGEGDDGSINNFYLSNEGPNSWNEEGIKAAQKLDFGQELAETLVEEPFVTWDWVNNDGGGGSVALNFVTGEIDVDGYYNETVRHSQGGPWKL